MDTILNTIEDVKHKLTDAEYKALMDGLMEVHNAPPQQLRLRRGVPGALREVLPDDMGSIRNLDDVVDVVETLTHNRDLWELEQEAIEKFVDWFWEQSGTSRPQLEYPLVWDQLDGVKKHIETTKRELETTKRVLGRAFRLGGIVP